MAHRTTARTQICLVFDAFGHCWNSFAHTHVGLGAVGMQRESCTFTRIRAMAVGVLGALGPNGRCWRGGTESR